jgi:cobalamin synthase
MKKYKLLLEIALFASLTVVSMIAIAPETFVMPNAIQMILMVTVIGLIAMFLVFVWRENPDDEREAHNQALASRVAYIVGASVLIIALLIQGIQHNLDPAIPIALLLMLGTKLILQRYLDNH